MERNTKNYSLEYYNYKIKRFIQLKDSLFVDCEIKNTYVHFVLWGLKNYVMDDKFIDQTIWGIARKELKNGYIEYHIAFLDETMDEMIVVAQGKKDLR